MDTKTVLSTIKGRIKQYACEQTLAKRARKETLPKEELEMIKARLGKADLTPYGAALFVYRRKAEITAMLNFVHELRGHEFRHGIRKGAEYAYDKADAALRKEFAVKV